MRRLSILFLLVFALLMFVAGPTAQAQTGTTTWTANPLPMTQTTRPTLPADPSVFNTVSVLTFTATSTADTEVTAVSGRKKLSFKPNATGTLWVSLGSTTATVSGANCVPVSYGEELVAELDAYLPVAYISSTSFSCTLVQYGQNALRP